eukprot:8591700-Pyramimonas_sp.AAC.1
MKASQSIADNRRWPGPIPINMRKRECQGKPPGGLGVQVPIQYDNKRCRWGHREQCLRSSRPAPHDSHPIIHPRGTQWNRDEVQEGTSEKSKNSNGRYTHW